MASQFNRRTVSDGKLFFGRGWILYFLAEELSNSLSGYWIIRISKKLILKLVSYQSFMTDRVIQYRYS